MAPHPFEDQLGKNPANYVPLTPLSFLPRAAEVFPGKTAIVHGKLRRNWLDVYQRCLRLAAALTAAGAP